MKTTKTATATVEALSLCKAMGVAPALGLLAQQQLGGSTPKREAASERFQAALRDVETARAELWAALGDVEDAV